MAGRSCGALIALLFLVGPAWGQSATTTAYLRQTSFTIPFQVSPAVEEPIEVQLFVSTDGGRSWQLAARETPATGRFVYRAPREGTYWFASKTIGRRSRPVETAALAPELVVWVDTTQPKLDLRVRRIDRQRLEASWTALDPLLDAATLQIEYRLPDRPWQLVAVRRPQGAPVAQYADRVEWSVPPSAGMVDVRATIRDRAGNVTAANQRLLLRPQTPPALAAHRPADPSYGPSPDHGALARSDQHGFAPIAGEVWGDERRKATPESRIAGDTWPPFLPVAQGALPEHRADRRSAPPSHASDPSFPTAFPTVGQERLPVEELPAPPRSEEPVDSTSQSTTAFAGRPMPPGTQRPAAEQGMAEGSREPDESVSYTARRRFRLEYDVDAAGRGDVAEVQLWVTRDDGRTWRLWGKDADRESPFEVEVEADGRYGFRMVVVATNGLASPAPKPGDPADMRVVVDTASPTVRLTGAVYGQAHQAGKLIITWEADDPNLARDSVRLSYAADPQGPWQSIAADLPNSGEFAWRPDASMPRRVWLRIEVSDRAGNRGSFTHSTPIDLAGLAPRARIRRIRP